MSFFTLKELAERLGCDPGTVRRQLIARGCPHVPAGNVAFFTDESVCKWLKENERRKRNRVKRKPGQNNYWLVRTIHTFQLPYQVDQTNLTYLRSS